MNEKILFITDYFGPNPGGIENFHTGLVHKWHDDIISICFDHHYYVDNKELEYFNSNFKKPLYRIDTQKKNIFSSKNTIHSFTALIQQIRTHYHIKHIIIGNLFYNIKYIYEFIMNLDIPYSIILHPIDLEHLSLYHIKTYKFIKQAKYIFVYTNYFYELALVKGIASEQLVKIPFGLYIRWDDNNQKVRSELKEQYQKYKSKIKILTMGPLTKKKKFERIINVLQELKELIELEQIVWFIGGSGSEYYYLNELIKNYQLDSIVKLLGFLNDKEVGFLYFFSDIYFHPGGIEKDQFSGYSTTLLEAGYTALPSVAVMGAAIDDIIQNNITGFIFRYDDYKGMALKLKELIYDSKIRKKIGSFAEQKILKEFSIERSLYNIYQRIY